MTALTTGHPMPTPQRQRRVVLGPVLGLIALGICGLVVLALVGTTVGTAGIVVGIVCALVPVGPVVATFLWVDRWEPEPPRLLLVAFLWGAGFAALSSLIINSTASVVADAVLGQGSGDVIGAVVVAPVVEEAMKGAFLVGLLLLRRREWKQVLATLALALLLTQGTRAVLFRVYDVPRFETSMIWAGFLGAHVAGGTPLLENERAVLDDIHPLDDHWRYTCYSNVPTIWSGRFDHAALERHKERIPSLLGALTLRNPEPVVDHIACASALLWKITRGQSPMHGAPIHAPTPGNPTGIYALTPQTPRFEPPWPELARWVMFATAESVSGELSWLLWRPALPFFLTLLACAVACLRRRAWQPGIVLLPLLGHTAVLAMLIPSPDVRYQYPAVLIALLLVPAWLAGSSRDAAVWAPSKTE